MQYYKAEPIVHYIKSKLYSFSATGIEFFQTKKMKFIFNWIFLIGVFLYLLSKLSKIGWENIIPFLPSSPLFYLLSLSLVALPIMAEYLSLQLILKKRMAIPLKFFVRKHVLNEAVMSYSGEAYFIHKLSKLMGLNLAQAAIIVKNLALIRTFVSNFKLLLFVFLAILLGHSDSLQSIAIISPTLAIVVSVISISVCVGTLVFFRKLSRIAFGLAVGIATVYLIRSLLVACVLVVQWNLVIPGTSLAVWMGFLVIYSVSKKSPVGGDLVFVSVALTVPGLANNGAAIAAMLLTATAVVQVIYLLGFVTTSKIPTPSKLKLPLES